MSISAPISTSIPVMTSSAPTNNPSSSTISNPTFTPQQLVYAVTNVYSQFSFKLTVDGSKYKLWCRIFTDICQGAKVMGHINGTSKPTSDNDEDWHSIDSRVKSWFYSTCDPNILQVITTDKCTAHDLWENLHDFFLNNKMSRMLQLQEQFRNVKKGASSITDYCHSLKHLADALHDVDSTITDLELVMQILSGLPPSYQSIVDVITNTKPFPSFLEAKNMLLVHESREESHNQMLEPTHNTSALYSIVSQSGKSKNKWNKHRNNNKGTSKRGGNSGFNSSTNQFAGPPAGQQSQFAGIMGSTSPMQTQTSSHNLVYTYSSPSFMQHNFAPHGEHLQTSPHTQLPFMPGPRPMLHSQPSYQQMQAQYNVPGPFPLNYGAPSLNVHHASFGQHAPRPTAPNFGSPHVTPFNGNFPQMVPSQQQPTDLSSVFQAMSLQPPPDNQYYMDTVASAHMSFNQGS